MLNVNNLLARIMLVLILAVNSVCQALSVEEILNILPSKPALSDKEINILYNYASAANTIIEFGTGGSSFLFSAMDKTVYSFDTDQAYMNSIKNHAMMRDRLNIKHFFFYCDVGAVGPWGFPLKPEGYNFFSSIGKYLLEINLSKVDLFFIDGRYRVESALSVFANSKDDAIFIIHDFTNRDYYHELLEYFEIIETIETLVVLKKKDGINPLNLGNMLIKYQQDYR